MATTTLSTYRGRRTLPLYLLLSFRALARKADRLYHLLGYVCGLELLLLGFFITYQVVARKLDWPQAPGHPGHERLCPGDGRHVGIGLRSAVRCPCTHRRPASLYGGQSESAGRLDSPIRPGVLRLCHDLEDVENVISDYQNGVTTNDYPLTPLFIPKTVVAVGFSLLVVTTGQMMLSMIAERVLPKLHKAMGGEEIE